MYVNKRMLITEKPAQVAVKGELNLSTMSLSTMSDNHIMNQIYETHVHADENLNVHDLFDVSEDVLKHATNIVDKAVLGAHAQQEHHQESRFKASFSPPLCTLKQLSCEMTCKAPGEETAHQTTMSMLHKLSDYSWEAKAVLTLAAFALEYGDFWLLAQLHSSDQLAKSVGILKRVPTIARPPGLQKHAKEIVQLNNLIKATLEVIDSMLELEALGIHDTKDVPALLTAMDHKPVDVYWAIMTIVACTTQMYCLTGNEDKKQELSFFAQKINISLNFLKMQIKLCHQQIAEMEAYRKIVKMLQVPTEIMEFFKALVFGKDNVQQLIDGSAQKLVSVDVLKKKNVLLLISGLDISVDEISNLKPIYEGLRKEEQYKIVWIPIVEQWTDELLKMFEILRSKMPWYIVQYFSPVVGMKFIKEVWNFKNKPLLVVMSPQSKVEHTNALHMIRVWGMNAFPFTLTKEEELPYSHGLWHFLLPDNPQLGNPVREGKYIFFYGGKDEWIQQFSKKANALVNDPVIKGGKIDIELFCVGKNNKGEDDLGILGRFWSAVESFFFCMTHKKTEPDPLTQEIQKLLSCKNENGWAVLGKGSKPVASGHGTVILKVVDEFEKWKAYVLELGFEVCFKEYLEKLIEVSRPCCRVDLPMTGGKIPEHLKCPHCPRDMETYISFKCCHIDGPLNALH